MGPTAFIHTFRVAAVHRLIKAARRHVPEGWRKSAVDPCAVLASTVLRLKPG